MYYEYYTDVFSFHSPNFLPFTPTLTFSFSSIYSLSSSQELVTERIVCVTLSDLTQERDSMRVKGEQLKEGIR